MWAGAWFSPPSARPWPTRCLPVATTPSASVVALERRDVGAAQLGREVRVLAVRLLDAAPARVAADVEDRARAHGGRRSAASAGGSSRRPRRRVAGSKRRGRADRLLEARGVPGHQAVQALLVDDGRDAEPGLLDEVALDGVGRPRPPRSGAGSSSPARRVISPMPSSASAGEPRRVERRRRRRPRTPRPSRAGRASRQGHPREQVGDPLVDRPRRIAVGRGADGVRRHRLIPSPLPAVRPPTSWRSATT